MPISPAQSAILLNTPIAPIASVDNIGTGKEAKFDEQNEEHLSMSSTIDLRPSTFDLLLKQLGHQQNRRHRRVYFDENANQYHHPANTHHDDQEIDGSDQNGDETAVENKLWCDVQDYKAFRKERVADVKRMRKRLRKKETEYCGVMQRVYYDCCQAKQDDDISQSPVLRAQFRICIKAVSALQFEQQEVAPSAKPTQQQEETHEIVAGLEKLVVPGIERERKERRRRLLNAVLEIQQEKENDRFRLNAHQRMLHIAQTCQDISRPSKLFAVHLAKPVKALGNLEQEQ